MSLIAIVISLISGAGPMRGVRTEQAVKGWPVACSVYGGVAW